MLRSSFKYVLISGLILRHPAKSLKTQSFIFKSGDGGKRVKFAPSTDQSSSDVRGGSNSNDGGNSIVGGVEELELEGVGDSSSSKKKVIEAGYDSDSSAGSDGGFGIGGGRSGRLSKNGESSKEGAGEDDDEDMFSAAKEDSAVEKGKGKGKEFLEIGDIEGQEFGKGDDDDDGEESELDEEEEDYIPEDDLANDDDAPRSKRSKSSMGYKLSSFNMAEELAEGRFSADGSYVANQNDPLATHDVWLDGVSKSAIKAARESKRRMEEAAKARDGEDANGEEALAQQRDDCLIGLLSIVRAGETVTKALARLGAHKTKNPKVKKPPKPEQDAAMDVDGTDASKLASAASKGKGTATTLEEEDPVAKKINTLTHFASTLLSKHGEIEIYDQTYDDIMKTLKSEGAVRRDWVPPKDQDSDTESITTKATGLKDQDHLKTSLRSRPLIARPMTTSTASAPLNDGKKYYYKWNTPPPGQPKDEEYGPFNISEIASWVAGSYFGENGSSISLRAEDGSAWTTYQALRA